MKIYTRLHVLVLFLLIIGTGLLQAQKTTRRPDFEAYILKYKDLAIQQQHLYKIPASITLAQGLLETDGGKSRLARVGNNHFGIKCKEEWKGGRMYHDDDEANECFRTYKSAEDSYLDHSLFLSQRKYYVSLFDLNIYDYKGWARGLQNCGYATSKTYATSLINIINTYELHKYDRVKVSDKAKSSEKSYLDDDIYEIKLKTPGSGKPILTNWRRRIHEVNGSHYITAQTNDSYDIISYDTRMKLKRLLKYNEVERNHPLKEGDFVFLQPKKKQAAKGNSTHIVQKGESIHSISQKYGMKLKSLYKLNHLNEYYKPKPGDILRVRK